MSDTFASVKEWKCPKGHVLGVVRRVKEDLNGKTYHVSKLYLYRHAVDMQAERPAEVDVIGPVEGSGGPFRCDVPGCGRDRRWEIGEDAFERLLEKMNPTPTPLRPADASPVWKSAKQGDRKRRREMITKSGEWWDYSWNVAPGCTKVDSACANCWALAMARRLQEMKKPGYEGLVTPTPLTPLSPGLDMPEEHRLLDHRATSPHRKSSDRGTRWTGRVNLLEHRLEVPLRLKRPRTIAVNLMGDLFHPEVPDEFIGRVFEVMLKADWHTFMVLTKRPERMAEWAFRVMVFAGVPANIWLGTTAGTQRSANERWGAMAKIAYFGWKAWVSSEPRLEAIDWHGWEFLKLLVTGGESGPYARPMSPAWPRADRDWCQAHGVAFWFKQWGEWGPLPPSPALPPNPADLGEGGEENYAMTTIGNEMLFRLGRKTAGRVLDGRIWEEEPFNTKETKEHEGEQR